MFWKPAQSEKNPATPRPVVDYCAHLTRMLTASRASHVTRKQCYFTNQINQLGGRLGCRMRAPPKGECGDGTGSRTRTAGALCECCFRTGPGRKIGRGSRARFRRPARIDSTEFRPRKTGPVAGVLARRSGPRHEGCAGKNRRGEPHHEIHSDTDVEAPAFCPA